MQWQTKQCPQRTFGLRLTENLDRLRKSSTDYFEMLEAVADRRSCEQCDHMQRNLTATFDLGQAD